MRSWVLLFALVACHKPSAERAYVSNEDSGDVTVIDTSTDAVVATIHVGMRPRGLRLSPDHKTLYVALSGSPKRGSGEANREADGIGVIDVSTMKLVRTMKSGQDPEAFDVSSDGKEIVVSNEETAQASFVDVASGAVRAAATVGEEPEGVAMRPGTHEVWVTSESGGAISVVDTNSRAVLASISAPSRPRAVAFLPDGSRAFVTAETGGVVHVIDATTHTPETDIALAPGSRPMGVRVSSDGKTVYVTNGRAGTLSVIDVASRKVTRTIENVGARPWGIDTAQSGKLYVANGPSNDVSIIDAASGNVLKHVAAGQSPWGVVVGTL